MASRWSLKTVSSDPLLDTSAESGNFLAADQPRLCQFTLESSTSASFESKAKAQSKKVPSSF